MKKIIKLISLSVTFIFLFEIKNLVYGAGRLVDIPVPPNSSGYADFTSEEGEKKAKEYKENQENTNNTAEENVVKSGNNYLKRLEIEGYSFEPKFNGQKDEYILYVKDKSELNKLNIIAEAEEPKAKIDGCGTIEITAEQNIININVIAENGNLKVYTIKIENIENEESRETLAYLENQENSESQVDLENQINQQEKTYKRNIIIMSVVIIIGMICVIFAKHNKKGNRAK